MRHDIYLHDACQTETLHRIEAKLDELLRRTDKMATWQENLAAAVADIGATGETIVTELGNLETNVHQLQATIETLKATGGLSESDAKLIEDNIAALNATKEKLKTAGESAADEAAALPPDGTPTT